MSLTPRALVEDLDQLPYPDRNYEPGTVLGRSIMPILASRGCARTCSFCSIHTFYRAAPGKIVRTRKPAEVVREMSMLHEERGITIFLFQDDDFPLFGTVWRRWANEFVDELHRSGLPEKVIWKMNCRADAVDRELFIRMRDAGLYLVYMGLESGSEAGPGDASQADHRRTKPQGGEYAKEHRPDVGIRIHVAGSFEHV